MYKFVHKGYFSGLPIIHIHLFDFSSAGYQLSAKCMEAILKRYSRAMDDGRLLIAFDDFVALSVRLRAYTGKYIMPSSTIEGFQIVKGFS